MKRTFAFLFTLGVVFLKSSVLAAETELFKDDFAGGLGEGWSWKREDKSAWRVRDGALEIKILPGNLWGPLNNVTNVLSRPAPDTAAGPVEVLVTVTNSPVHQYEQANVAWYFDDSNMVKLGLELVDGKVCIVMGREEADRIRTLAKIPVTFTSVQLRLIVEGNHIRGQYRATGVDAWLDAGEGDLPSPHGRKALISLHSYQGAPDVEHWARFTGFRISRIAK